MADSNTSVDADRKRVFKQDLVKKLLLWIPGGRVSKVHLHEAQERYITLYRMVDFYSQYFDCDEVTRLIEADAAAEGQRDDGAESREVEGASGSGSNGDTTTTRIENNPRPESKKKESICKHLLTCYEILTNIKDNYLTRKEDQLGFAWRELTRVRITLTDHILPADKLAEQVDACREEANRLAVSRDHDIGEMLQRLAESLDESSSNKTSEVKIRRQLKALLERFNTIRTRRIRHQYLNVRAYTWAVTMLIFLSFILIANSDLILCLDKRIVQDGVIICQTAEVQAAASALDQGSGLDTTPAGADAAEAKPAENGQSGAAAAVDGAKEVIEGVGGFMWDNTGHAIGRAWRWFVAELSGNVLLFVYLAGLTGGFFSVAIRARNRESAQGDDAYVLRYVLTKPFVGALGAIILFILFHGGIIQSDLVAAIGSTASPKVFGFAFLSGFSERVVFPEFK